MNSPYIKMLSEIKDKYYDNKPKRPVPLVHKALKSLGFNKSPFFISKIPKCTAIRTHSTYIVLPKWTHMTDENPGYKRTRTVIKVNAKTLLTNILDLFTDLKNKHREYKVRRSAIAAFMKTNA